MSRRRRFEIDRRMLLRGLLGGAAISVGLPPLEAMFNATGTAYADGTLLPRRFGLFYWGNGNLPQLWNPANTGSGADWQLSDQLSPLAAVKPYVTVVSGMEVRVPRSEPHMSGAAGILSAIELHREGENDTFAGPSIDQVIAQGVGDDTRFRSLEFGAEAKSGLSFNGPNSKNPPETSPIAFFERVFGEGFRAPGDDSEPDPRIALRRSVLDAVMDDATRLRTRVGAADKARLDQHFEGIRELELRLARLEEDPPDLAACAVPDTPDAAYPDIDGRPQVSAKNRAMCDVLAMALACDQTRVFSNFLTYPVNNTLFPAASNGHHNLTHDEPGDQPEVNAIVKQIIGEYAYLVERLASIEEADGTLLDNAVVFATSDVSLGRTHDLSDFPIVYAGSACGRLKTDMHYRSDTAENATKVLLSFIRAMDITVASFGEGDAQASDGLGDIEV